MNEMLIMSGKDTGLLRMTKWMVEIATSHRTLPRNDGFGMGMINQAPTRDFKKGAIRIGALPC